MIYEIVISDQADADLRGVYEHIAFELLSPDHAARQLERLEQHIVKLEAFPERYRLYEREPWRSRGLRVMSVDRYLIFYITNLNMGTVTIIRVLYAGRDIDDQLKDQEYSYFCD